MVFNFRTTDVKQDRKEDCIDIGVSQESLERDQSVEQEDDGGSVREVGASSRRVRNSLNTGRG